MANNVNHNHNDGGSSSSTDDERENSHESVGIDPDSVSPLEVPSHEHRLQYDYWMWFSRRPSSGARNNSSERYGQALRMVGRCSSVEQWWGLYCHLARPCDLPLQSDLHLFKFGIKPMWEDPANANGGKWVVRLRKHQTGRAWEDVCMAVLGEQFMVGDEICGVVVSVRFQEDHLAVWHRSANDAGTVARVRDTLKRVLGLPATTHLEYKAHGERLNGVA